MIERFVHKKKVYAEVIRANVKSEITRFFSNSKSSFQFGFVSHKKGYSEAPHYHKKILRKINDLQQVLFVQKGKLEVMFYNKSKMRVKCQRCKSLRQAKILIAKFYFKKLKI